MKIHNINLETKINEKLFHLAIGNFDGVHLGHQQIISKLVDKARLDSKLSAILSFNPHPKQFFSRELDRYQILGEETKQKILGDLGVNHYFLLNFDLSISNLSPSITVSKSISPSIFGDFTPSFNSLFVVNIFASSHSLVSIKDCKVILPPSIIID